MFMMTMEFPLMKRGFRQMAMLMKVMVMIIMANGYGEMYGQMKTDILSCIYHLDIIILVHHTGTTMVIL